MTETMSHGGARLMVGFLGTEPSAALRDLLHETRAGSVILFARNIIDAAHARDLVAGIRELVPWPLLVAVDQEGGVVVRVEQGATVFPGNMALGAAGSESLALAQGRESGRQLAWMGFDLNLAPVIDLQTNPMNPGIGVRSLGADPALAVRLARALCAGHAESGVGACLKHFPGKGAAAVDAHYALPVLEQSLAAFRHPHVAVFEALCESVPGVAVMTSHVVVTGLDPDAPATFSPRVVAGLLRGELGFRGLVLCDDLEMGAIVEHVSVDDAAVRAARASHDLILVCHSPERQRAAARALDAALHDGRIARDDHEVAVARIRARAASHARVAAIDPASGDAIAEAIASAAVHLFGDRRRLLPLREAQGVTALAFRPEAQSFVEETARGGFESGLGAELRAAGLAKVDVLGLDCDDASCGAALDAALARAERVLLFTWDAVRHARVRALLEEACTRAPDRVIVVHLRNPFDQRFVPADVTALTAFGYRRCQMRALAAVLAGRAQASGGMPAPLYGAAPA